MLGAFVLLLVVIVVAIIQLFQLPAATTRLPVALIAAFLLNFIQIIAGFNADSANTPPFKRPFWNAVQGFGLMGLVVVAVLLWGWGWHGLVYGLPFLAFVEWWIVAYLR